ncbi:hypothetical protein Tco_1050775, partial [Tanacetum coccineum]
QRPAGALANLVADEKCSMEVVAFDRYLCFSNACLQLQAHGSPTTAGCVHTLAGIVATDDNVTEDQPRSAILGFPKSYPNVDSTIDLALDDLLPVVEKGKVSDGVEHVVHELSVHCDPPVENLNAKHK